MVGGGVRVRVRVWVWAKGERAGEVVELRRWAVAGRAERWAVGGYAERPASRLSVGEELGLLS